MDINSVCLIGRLSGDVEVKQLTGSSVLNFTIASNRSVKRNDQWVDEVSFFDVSYFTKGTKIADMLKKGTQVGISGSLQQQRWEKDGKKFSKVVINADTVNVLGGKSQGSAPAPTAPTKQQFDGFPDDCPF